MGVPARVRVRVRRAAAGAPLAPGQRARSLLGALATASRGDRDRRSSSSASGGAGQRRCRRDDHRCSRPRRRSRRPRGGARRLPRRADARELDVQPAHVVRDHLPRGRARSPTRCATRRTVGPFRNLRVGHRHIHHFVPGIVIAFVVRRRGDPHARRAARADPGRAVRRRHGPDARRVGAAARARGRLLDARGPPERADHAHGRSALLGALALGLRFLRRGEELVLEPGGCVCRS